MPEQPPKPPRKPFGYDPTVVDQMMSDRDAMLALAERRVREAEAKAAKLHEQLAAQEHAVEELHEQLEAAAAARGPVPAPEPHQPEEAPLTPRFMTEELSKIIAAAEESTSQILEAARTSTREHILEADRMSREVQAEVARLSAWRQEAESVVNAVQAAVSHARSEIESVPERIQSALAPAVEAMVKVDAGMARFAAASTLPFASTPSGFGGEPSPSVEGAGSLSMPVTLAAGGLSAAAHLSELTEADWPSLDEPPSLDAADRLMAEASEELREFASNGEGSEHEVADESEVWGA